MEKTRTNYVIKNAWVGILAQSVALILSFVSRSLFIKILGNDYLGVNGLFTNILTILSVAELGIGEAIVFNLYKPIAENNERKIKVLISFYGKAYRIIGITIFILGLLVIPFMDLIITNQPSIKENLDLIYVLFLINTSLSYLYIYKSSLLKANQKNYVVVTYRQVFHCIQLVFQIGLLYITHNYILYLVIQFACTIINNIFISKKTEQMYPYLKDNNIGKLTKEEKKEIFSHIKGSFLYKFGSSILNGTDSIIISRYLGVGVVGLASNYLLINNTIKKYTSQLTSSFTASLGNLNAIEANEKKEQIMYRVLYICFLIYGFCTICLILLSNDFIKLWLGEKYLFSFETVIIMISIFYMNGTRYASWAYRVTLGLFRYGKFIPLTAAIINVILSIVLAKKIGINGVYIGTIVSTMSTYFFADPIIIYNKEFHKSPLPYFIKYFKYAFITAITCAISYFATRGIVITNIWILIFKLIICIAITITIFILTTYRTNEFNNLKAIILKKLKRFKKQTNV